MKLIETFSVTRSKRCMLVFDPKCRVIIPRSRKLDKIALAKGRDIASVKSRGSRTMHRTLSTQSMQDDSPPPNDSQPRLKRSKSIIDFSKVRSILKTPSDKPRSIFNRRKSISFSQTNEIIEQNSSPQSADDAMLIDFSDCSPTSSNQQPNARVLTAGVLQPEVLHTTNEPMQRDIDNVESNESTQIHNYYSVLDEFDPFNGSSTVNDDCEHELNQLFSASNIANETTGIENENQSVNESLQSILNQNSGIQNASFTSDAIADDSIGFEKEKAPTPVSLQLAIDHDQNYSLDQNSPSTSSGRRCSTATLLVIEINLHIYYDFGYKFRQIHFFRF